VVLQRGNVSVVEIKGHLRPTKAALDQALGYARDLAAYHAACAGKKVTAILVTRGATDTPMLIDGVYVASPESLDWLLEQLSCSKAQVIRIQDFLALDAYAPLPSIVQAARELFHKHRLPFIKRARATTEPALEYITAVAHEAAQSKARHLVLLSGVPGSGKTLVGLQLVHAGWLDDLAVARDSGKPAAPAVYLSGNGPLVQVLQDALAEAGGGGRKFVQSIKNYVAYHSRRRTVPPPEHLIVFDEAQRAHDAERVAHVHHTELGQSEPEHLLEFCERIPEWSVLVALIGEGQAIHVGEEGGPALWADALHSIRHPGNWTVHAASHLCSIFIRAEVATRSMAALNLDTEIRFHLTPKVHEFVAGLLNGTSVADLRLLADELHDGGHRFLVTRDLNQAKGYSRERYADAVHARYGLLASSRDKWLLDFGVDNSFQTTKQLRVGPWYNALPTDPRSCCQLETVATEFSSQGLELDCAVLAWGSDLLWANGDWSIANSRRTRGHIRDPLSLRKNIYRVLLTRGRDGTVVFVPPDCRFETTFDHLQDIGFRPLKESV